MKSFPRIYLDNAATTPIDEEVVRAMTEAIPTSFGNPSSIHFEGRATRSIVETARKKIAQYLHCTPSEIFFTSGGTEADNMALTGAVMDLGVQHLITSPLEHHAVLHTAEHLERQGLVHLHLVDTDAQGRIVIPHLRTLLAQFPHSLVSLMEANNEIGTLTDLNTIGEVCREFSAYFHSDTVQTMGHYAHDVSKTPIDFMACAAHKLHGPKGVGFIYIRNTVKIHPLIHGGSQERNMRGGTENIPGIIGLSAAFELAEEHLSDHRAHIQGLKTHLLARLQHEIPGLEVNGCADPAESLYTVLNVSFPESDMGEMMLFNLDIQGISVSGGSACTSGSQQGSHVLTALKVPKNRPSVRFSFSKLNTLVEMDRTVEAVKSLVLGRQ